MELDQYLLADPSKLKVVQLKQAITLFGGVPGNQTKQKLISKFTSQREIYIQNIDQTISLKSVNISYLQTSTNHFQTPNNKFLLKSSGPEMNGSLGLSPIPLQ
ncbi:Protein_21.6 [Hexamita inflata]|uniref:Protein 21.6 n=1 Tax=Hexamita inflata TaxID=28002 RepID=A0AA86UUC6_9EUKA|nr:Protein 21.6 [Hexamita inflata]